MKATILITGEEKEKYLIKTIKSCLNQSYTKIEIILIYSNLRNLNKIKQKFKKKIRFLKIKKKINNPIRDQLYKISQGLKISKGKFIFLLDGDDLFKKDKVKNIMLYKNKNALFLNNHAILYKQKLIYKRNNILKKLFLYKMIFNVWPDKVCTSCISAPKILFKEFFKKIKITKINNLAIDILIIIYYLQKIFYLKEILTIKKISEKSVDKKYSNIFSRIYWERRIEQHVYLKKFKKINYSLEFYVCKIIFRLFDFHKHIQKIF